MSRVLVTGGAGYIGSHACVELLQNDHEVVVVDDLSNSFGEALERVTRIAGKALEFHEGDYGDRSLVDPILNSGVDAVMHFAGFKAVGESVEKPLDYYQNNVAGTLNLLQSMREANLFDLVFSSSCTVYGQPDVVPITEATPLTAASPYGWTKLMIEQILRDVAASEDPWKICLLRYFNPVGAHPSGLIGEDPRDVPNNLMPYIMQVAAGKLKELKIFGSDYPTRDGTAIRDYIHVVDLVKGHLKALDALSNFDGCRAYNLGTGVGTTVLEVVQAVEEAIGVAVPHQLVDRRQGDVIEVWADPQLAEKELGWKAELDVVTMCRDHWKWQDTNPEGYRSE